METYQTLSIESFSYSWLANTNPSFESPGHSFRDSLDAYDEASFIEMDLQLSSSKSKKFFKVSHDFDFPTSQAPMTLLHADELIFNGFIMPVFAKQVKKDAYNASDPTKTSPCLSSSSEKLHSDSSNRTRSPSLRKCRKLSKQIFLKYLNFLRPLCQRVRGQRSGSRVGTCTTGLHGERNWNSSASTSPRASVSYSTDNWQKSCDSESSIYEAVLYCKRTIGE